MENLDDSIVENDLCQKTNYRTIGEQNNNTISIHKTVNQAFTLNIITDP